MKTFATLFAVVISFGLHAQDLSKQFKDIDSIIESKIKKDHPGLMVGIVKDGNIIYEKYHGLANLSFKIKMDENTRSNIASTAKQFTALMILKLSLEGKLDLEDDIRKYMPNLYPQVKEEIKIRHLINHTAGIRDYVGLMDMQGEAFWKRVGLNNNDIIELTENQQELAFKPGTDYSYSNSGYVVLAKIIENVTDEKFTDYSKKFFEELGMNNTAFIEGYMRVIPNRAEPYADWGSGVWFQSPTVTKTAGEGFLYTTLKDQLIYEQAVQNAEKKNNELLIKSQKAIPNSEITTYGYGLRLFNWYWGERASVHHDGGTNGYNSQTVRFTDDKLTVFVMSNNGNIGSDVIADEVANVLLPKIEVKKNTTYDSRYYDTANTSTQQQVIGQYISSKGTLIRIVEVEGKTYYKRGGNVTIELIPESKNQFYPSYNSEEKIVFYKDEMILFEPSGETKIFERSTALPATLSDLKNFVGRYDSAELDMSFELRLTEDNELKIKFSNREDERDVTALNRDELLSRNFILKVERDQFDRPADILVTLGRAANNRFKKKTNLKFQPQIPTEGGTIQVTTIGSREGDNSDILLTKNYLNGNEIWNKRFGGKSYDKASSIVATPDGYLIVGSTSSYGNGNYDMYVIKTDKDGKKEWQNTYGDFYNEYGYTAEVTDKGYVIKGTIQKCTSNSDVFNRTCTTNVWFVSIDDDGKEISNEILDEIKKEGHEG
ncbi:serine hydrolase domain-containing protein [Winogradskyella tangerina]|uniref:serine hydrolase domain-containing protein n=1 Tax=Winogradskyella tangerina TaxID=2023240 RepID=UPI000DBE213F|nr:serine hydrolase domain-containing protein [Winogradskyella tangerina]